MGLWSSLRLSVWALCLLAAWLGLGAAAAALAPRAPGLASLDAATMQVWWLGHAGEHPWLAAWLAGLLLLAGLLSANLVVCSFTRLASWRGPGRGRRLLVLAVHLLALAAVGLQGASFFTGAKQTRLRLAPGQAVELGSGARLRLAGVEYTGDPALLRLKGREARRALTREAFDRQANLARVELRRQGRPAQAGAVRFFHPAELGGWRVFLVGFHLCGPGGRPPVGAVLNLVQSPLWPWFLCAYAGLVGGLLWLTGLDLLAGRRPNRD